MFSDGCVNDRWKEAIKTEVAERIMELSKLDFNKCLNMDKNKLSSRGRQISLMKSTSVLPAFFKSDKFWLSTAALTVITSADWLELSPTWQKQKVLTLIYFFWKVY